MYEPRTEVFNRLTTASPIFPPSFDNSPMLFGLALFSRLLILVLASATVVRIVSRTRNERLPHDHPVFYHRAMVACLLSASILATLSDVLTWLAWNEIDDVTLGWLMTATKVMDALTVVPFLMGLFVPFWVYYLRRIGILKGTGGMILTGAMADMRITWGQVGVPVSLAAWCAVGAMGVTLAKWLAWYGTYVSR